MDDRLRKLLDFAVLAPSGDNCQPWAFAVVDDVLQIRNRPDADTSLYNYRQRASLIAHGALLENLAIAAPSLGLRATIRLFPDPAQPDLVATATFSDGEAFDDPLLPHLARRCTNRKKYTAIPLSEAQKGALLAAVEPVAGTRLAVQSDPAALQDLAAALANNDRLVFENIHLHRFLFDHIRWSDEEARRSRDGMDIKTLELAPLDALAFPWFRYWPLVGILNKVGLSKLVAQNGRRLLGSSAGIAGLSVDRLDDEGFVLAGRAMQRFWLEATVQGLSVQPVAGVALLIQRLRSGETAELSEEHRRLIEQIGQELEARFAGDGQSLVMLFRLGTSAPPSARALRREPVLTGP